MLLLLHSGEPNTTIPGKRLRTGPAITKHLVELMGGTIAVKSEGGRRHRIYRGAHSDIAPDARCAASLPWRGSDAPLLWAADTSLCADHPPIRRLPERSWKRRRDAGGYCRGRQSGREHVQKISDPLLRRRSYGYTHARKWTGTRRRSNTRSLARSDACRCPS